MDPMSNVNENIIPRLPSNQPSAETIEEISKKVATILTNNGFINPNIFTDIKANKGLSHITVWIEPEDSHNQQNVVDILKTNGFTQDLQTRRKGDLKLTLHGVRVSIAINRKGSFYIWIRSGVAYLLKPPSPTPECKSVLYSL